MEHEREHDHVSFDASVDDVETEFWSRVPERRFGRAARRPATPPAATARAATSRRSSAAHPSRRPGPAGTRTHHDDTGPVAVPRPITQSIPVVTEAVTGSVRQATRHVDPLIRRLGVAAIVTALAIPVAMSLRDDPSTIAQPQVAAAAAADTDATNGAAGTTAPPTAATDGNPWASIDVNALPEAVPVNPDPTAAPVVEAAPAPKATSAATAPTAPPAKAATATRTNSAPAKPACGAKYTIRSGDAWLLIAQRAKVTLSSLLSVNGATRSTALYPGRTICLPAGASMPKPAAVTTTTKPRSPAATKPAASKPPTTTAPAPAPTVNYSRAQVEKIIRQVWPDNLEDRAVAIATRESNLHPNVRNYCCYGLFQIYYNVHKSWLANIGITSASKLYDPKLNAFAAYVLYLRSGSFAPWGG